jgi:ribosomal protein S18 acetylase RimI-like enzyme
MIQNGVVIGQASSESEIAQARALLHEYISWAFSIEEGAEDAPTFQGIEEELETLPGIYTPPLGRLLVALYEGEVVGCVCLKPLDDDTCEVKRLYVSPAKRGLSIGNSLITTLVEEARRQGYKKIVLDSHVTMKSAHAIYAAAGFQRIPAPPGYPENIDEIAIFMECKLTA